MKIFKSKRFAKFADKEGLSDAVLCKAIRDVEAGNIEADYGGHVFKQRIARLNEGKSGGYRTIIIFRKADRAFFVYGFAKNEQSNIDKSDERDFKDLAKRLLAATDKQLKELVTIGKFIEVKYDHVQK